MEYKSKVNMKIKDFLKADTTRVYYYATKAEALSGNEHRAANEQELQQAIAAGQVWNYRIETNDFYFLNKEGKANG